MAVDHSLPVRQAVVEYLLSADHTDLRSLIGTKVFGMFVPNNAGLPRVCYTGPDTVPYEDCCSVGSEVSFVLNVFSQSPTEDECASITAELVNVLDEDTLPLASGVDLLAVDWVRTQILPDETCDGFRAIVDFIVTTREAVS